MAAIRYRVGPCWRAQQRETQDVAGVVVTVFGVVQQTEAVLAVVQIGPAQRRNFELRLIPAVVAGGWAFDAAVWDFVGGLIAGCGQRESRFEQYVVLMPVDVVDDVDLVRTGGELNLLYELRFRPMAGHLDRGACRTLLDQLDGISIGQLGRRNVQRAGIDVTRVVVLRRVFERLQLIAASAAGKRFEVRFLVVEAGDAACGFIYDNADSGVLQSQSVYLQIARERLFARNDMQDLIAHGWHVLRFHEQLVGVGFGIAGKLDGWKNVSCRVKNGNSVRSCVRHLHAHFDRSGALPRQWIEDQDGNFASSFGVDLGGDGLQRLLRDLACFQARLVELLLGFL